MTGILIKVNNSIIKELSLHDFGPPFKFIVNDKEYQTSKIIACMISPKIRNKHTEDNTFDEYSINTGCNEGNFQPIIELIKLGQIEIQEEEVPFISLVLKELENNLIEVEIPEIEITEENIFNLIKKHDKYQNIYSKQLQKEIDFLSKFFFLTKNKVQELLSLSLDTMENILKNEMLILESEDQLITLLNNMYKADKKYSVLYQYVNFIKVTANAMKDFTSTLNFCDLNEQIWSSISNRLTKSLDKGDAQQDDKNLRQPYGIPIIIKPNAENRGIIHLIQALGKSNKIHIFSSSTHSSTYEANNIIKYETNDCFQSQNVVNTWICIDFADFRVIVTHFTIETAHWPAYHPRSFVLEGSNDISNEANWEKIDQEDDSDELDGEGISHTFEASNKDRKIFRYIRFRQTGKTKNNHYYLIFRHIEFYGSLIKPID